MRKTLNTLLAASTIGLASLLPLKKAEAQQNIVSIFSGVGPSPINPTLNFFGNPYQIKFEDTQIFGMEFARRQHAEARINPSLELEVYLSKNIGKRINYVGFSNSSQNSNCEFGEKNYFDIKFCRKMNDPSLLSFSAAILYSIQVHPLTEERLNQFSFYAGAGPLVRWSWFNLLDESSERRNFSFEFNLGARFQLKKYADEGQIFFEYSYDRAVPNFSGQKIRQLGLTDGGKNESSRRIIIGISKAF